MDYDCPLSSAIKGQTKYKEIVILLKKETLPVEDSDSFLIL